MISRYLFVCVYFLSFFLINRWYDLYQCYFNLSRRTYQILPVNQLNIKQLQYILNLRGITYANINEKYDLIKMVEQSGYVRENDLYEPIEDQTKRQSTLFSSYRQLLDFVDDCKDTLWFIHLLPNNQRRQSSIYLSSNQWQTIERRLSMFNIQTGVLNCSNTEYSNLCRTLKTERFVLLVPSINRRSTNIYSYDIYSTKQYDYQNILKWLSKTLENHVNQDFDWYELPLEKRSILEFQINSNSYISYLPICYFTLLYRYGSYINFHLNIVENQPFEIKFIFFNSSNHTYVYNSIKYSYNYHELYSFRSLNTFLSCLTANTQTLMYIYFTILNIYIFYDIYFVRSLSFIKKVLLVNIISGLLWCLYLTCVSTYYIDYLLQNLSFYLIKYSHNSVLLMYLRNDIIVYSLMSKWVLYLYMIVLHIGIGLCFRLYLKDKFPGMTYYDIPNGIVVIDQTHELCSKIWQLILRLLFSDHAPNEYTNDTLLEYFSQNSLWLDQHSLLSINPIINITIRPKIDFNRLPIWRFTIRRRKTNHGASEYHSDVELEQFNDINKQECKLKKSCLHRRITNIVSLTTQQDNYYTSESDENNNSFSSKFDKLNSSKIYQCSICLEKYFNNVYICTLPCLHHFHRQCLFDWLSNSEHITCPLCRSPVVNQ